MSTTTPLTDAINALTTYSNTVTGASDTDLSSAVATLAAGYGGGGGSGIGQDTPANILNMFYALENGTGTTGTFTLSTTVTTTDTELFDTGLSTVNGFALFDTTYYRGISGTTANNYSAFQILIMSKALVPYNLSTTYAGFSFSENGGNATAGNMIMGHTDNLDGTGVIRYGYFTLTDGKLYVRGQYNKNTIYTPLRATTYRWVAW